jgi:F-type H+-transporting ATPase subunit b
MFDFKPMANAPEVFATSVADMAEVVENGVVKHTEPALLGILDTYQIVSLSMLVLILIMIWKKVPGMITGGLDAKIEAIRTQLDEAKQLRAEAESLRNEYAAKIANAEKDAEAMIEGAQTEADAILVKAEADGQQMIARRKQMAENKISAAEREAVLEVRNRAASTAAIAARGLIAEKHDAAADSKLADQVIAAI